MKTAKLLHNPRCSKSRAALNFLNESNISVEVIEYLKKPLSLDEVKKLSKKLNLPPNQFVRKKENLYKELNLSKVSEVELFQALANHPILIERPILIVEDKAAIGRPLENIANLVKKE